MFNRRKDEDKPLVIAVVVAAGSGTRMKSEKNKQFMMLDNRPVLAHTLSAFSQSREIDKIIVVVREEDILLVSDLVREFNISKISKIIIGGDTRQQSVYNALCEIEEDAEKETYVAIHDGARPFIAPELIDEAVLAAQECDAVTVGVRVKDTVKRVNSAGMITETLNRQDLWQIQTPQVFEYNFIKRAHNTANNTGFEATDDCALLEHEGKKIYIIEGDYNNIKITTAEDFVIAQAIYDELY